MEILQQEVELLLLHDVPSVLSMGLLCRQNGCSFHWETGEYPILGLPGDIQLRLWSHNDTPLCCPLPFDARPDGIFEWEIPEEDGLINFDTPLIPSDTGVESDLKEPETVVSKEAGRDAFAVPQPITTVDNDNTTCSEEHIPIQERLAAVAKKRTSSRRREISNSTSNPLEFHNLCTHHPKHPDCPTCNGSKVQRQQCRKKAAKSDRAQASAANMPQPTRHGQSLTLDHMILEKDEDLSRNGDRVAAIILDLFSKWLAGCAAKTNSAETTQDLSLIHI